MIAAPATRFALRPLRLWPGVVAVALQWFARFALPAIAPETGFYGFLIGVFGGGLAVLLWWLFFSRAPWVERVGAVVLMVAGLWITSRVVHASIAGGMMGMMLPLFAIPVLCLALVVWAVATRGLGARARRAWLGVAVALACAGFTVVRTAGMTGGGASDFHWRWTETPEERLLRARSGVEREGAAGEGTAQAGGAAWPGFRGARRDGVVHDLRIETDWARFPPVELWRRPVGPGWSSFAVQGGRFYTQEQRGDEEVVSCYDLNSGSPVWTHRDAARFWESNAGAGPRATPALGDGRVYTLGATGIVNALDARDGSVAWSRDAARDTGARVPDWGLSASPLVHGDAVIVAAAGRLVAYDRASGEPRWSVVDPGWGYSSPHLASIGGIEQVLLLNGRGAIGVLPADGTTLWEHAWPGDGIVQPGLTAEGDVLIGTGTGMGAGAGLGLRRLAVAPAAGARGAWTVAERWTSIGLKPYFNDFVVHGGHAYGIDGGILACVDLADGRRAWKGGRYGHGQLLLLADQNLLLVLSERGELALVAAAPDQFREIARRPAIAGKTWNHPALAGDVLLLRNDQEMAAFRLARAGG